ncbi:putative ATP-dependent RNA helicase Ecm32p [Monosporozyma servazzii]
MPFQFECKTCHEKGPADQLMKHLSTTRHKTVIDVSNRDDPEELNCEDCKDNNNIHQLEIVRFGGDDMNIYCTSCLSKHLNNEREIDMEMKQSMVSYTLNNGALLPFWIKYKKYRDCVCDRCGNDDSKMNVKKYSQQKNKNNEQATVICNDCLKRFPGLKPDEFISEDSDKFIYYLLNIPEPANKLKKQNAKKRNMKGRRGKGRGKPKDGKGDFKTSKKPLKPLTIMEKLTKEAFSNKRENSKIISASTTSLSSFKGFKAVNSETNLQSLPASGSFGSNEPKSDNIKSKQTNSNSVQSTPNFSQFTGQDRSNIEKPSKQNATNNTKKNKKVKDQGLPSAKKTNNKKGKNETPTPVIKTEKVKTNKNSKPKQTKMDGNFSLKDLPKEGLPPPSTSKKDPIKGNGSKGAVKLSSTKHSGKENNASKKNKFDKPKNNKLDKPTFDKSKSDKPKFDKSKQNKLNKSKKSNKQQNKSTLLAGETITSVKEISVDSATSLLSGNDKSPRPSQPDKKERNTKNNKQDKRDSSSKDDEDELTLEEGNHLKSYQKFKPILTYPDMKTYFDTFSYALFQDEKLETPFIKDIKILWPKAKKDIVFVFKTAIDNPELQSMLPPHLLKAGRVPFNEKQPLMLVNKFDDSQVWYIFVKEVARVRKEYHVLAELFPWNSHPLPITLGSDDLMIMPTSVQTNRIIFSMTRLTNPKFIELVLGNNKIKQIKFNNRLKFSRDSLNASQKEAVETVLNNSVTVIQGPPGTGKTSTIEEIIVQLIENLHSYPILCVAASNIAIDNIAEKLMESKPDIRILRILSDRKESEYLPDHPLGSVCLHNLIMKDLPDDMRANYIAKQRGEILSANQDKKLYEKITKLTTAHVCRAQVILTTNITAGGRQLKVVKELPVVIMDESTQSSEVSTLVPLSLPGIKKFVFVGDDKQLSSFSNVPQLEMSFFERILNNGSCEEPKMLNIQYRMHPQISEFPINKIYNNKLQDGVTIEDKSWPGINFPLYFISCKKGYETKVLSKRVDEASSFSRFQGYTYINEHECDIIISTIYKLMDDKKVKLHDIGVVTPYSAQRDYISSRLVDDMIINPSRLAMIQETEEEEFGKIKNGGNNSISGTNSVRSHTVNIINGLQVATVDSFQGHEKNFIIFSCVRSNPENKIGFLTDKRRLNVALTRSKNGLILVGNDDVLERGGGMWQQYITYLRDRDLIFPSLDMY